MSRNNPAPPALEAPAEDPLRWLTDEAPAILDHVRRQGAVVIRGLRLSDAADLAAARDALRLLPCHTTEQFATRDDRGTGVVTPIHWPEDRELCPFQEGSAGRAFPSLVLTACVRLPLAGCAHHLSDTRRLPELLPQPLADRIRRHGWVLTRTFHEGFGMSWQEAFSVATREELEAVLLREEIEATWLPGGALRTTRARPGFIDHPVTGEACWFNDLAFFNTGSLDPTERQIMTHAFGKDLPTHTTLGDGSAVSDGELAALQAGYVAVRREVAWQEGDLIVADNLLTAQGRPALKGSPQFLVAFADECLPSPLPTPRRSPDGFVMR
ncbi:TauD/TfdA family dioxygenase [Micromonospora chersina]|uniref:TauD/TfdA family dioxygenase n=1 Tax=Micromonospora chersina TaxID=47854 RepID=UPI00371631C9